MFDNQIRRNAREGYKVGDKFLFLSLLSGLLLFDSIRNKPSRQPSYSSNKSIKQLEEEIAEFEKRWAKPFKCTQIIVMYSILLLFAFAMPFLGVYLYLQADWWMFCVGVPPPASPGQFPAGSPGDRPILPFPGTHPGKFQRSPDRRYRTP